MIVDDECVYVLKIPPNIEKNRSWRYGVSNPGPYANISALFAGCKAYALPLRHIPDNVDD
jgi:hypothetical protein